jgi:hypothetical protein
MSPYRVHAAPPDLLEVALSSAPPPRPIISLRGLVVVGIVGAVVALVGSGVALVPPSPPRVASHGHADPHRVTAARGTVATATGLSEEEEDRLLREQGMYGLASRHPRPAPDLR